jgi:two-component system sensor histidine kinase KdpD
LADYAIKEQVTQIVIGHSLRSGFNEFLRGNVVNKLIRLVRDIDVLVIRNSAQ